MVSPNTIGLDAPGPGSFAFQATFSFALQVTGSPWESLIPLPPGPRNRDHVSSAEGALNAASVTRGLAAFAFKAGAGCVSSAKAVRPMAKESIAAARRVERVRARERGLTRYIGYSGDGEAARFAVECGRFDTLQTSVSVADQEALELTLPAAVKQQLGVIAKRPIANAAWRYARRPAEPYHQAYWTRLRTLDYPFLRDAERAVSVALRFTLAAPGVHTAIVGTKRPGRWAENARLLEAGPLPAAEIQRIRARWQEVAEPGWTGEV